jgi:type II secretory pathway pseudopilin PulG
MKTMRTKLVSRLRDESGLTLLEVALAMGIFAIVMSVSAQVLIGFSGAMEVQEQRQEAIQHCRAVLTQIRQDRDTSVLAFPDQILAVWPDGREVTDPTIVTLPNEVITVDYVNDGADPLSVTITASWTDMQGRPAAASVSTLLTGTNR